MLLGVVLSLGHSSEPFQDWWRLLLSSIILSSCRYLSQARNAFRLRSCLPRRLCLGLRCDMPLLIIVILELERRGHPSIHQQPTNHSWWMRRDDRLVGSNWMLSGNDFNISWSRPFSWPILLAFRLSNPHTAQTNIMTSKRMMMGGRLTTYKAGQGEISSKSTQSMYSWTYKLCRVQSAIIKGLPSLWIINIKGLRTENPSKADLKAPSFCCHATGTAAATSTSSAAAAEPFPASTSPPAKKIKTSYLHPLWMSDLTFRESAEVEHDHDGLIARNTSKFEGGGENFRLQVGVSSLLLLLLSNKVRILLLCSREIVTISMDELYGV